MNEQKQTTKMNDTVKPYVIGVDLGGTNTVFGIVNQRGEVLCDNTIRTQEYATAEAFVEAGVACLQPLIEHVGGIATIKAATGVVGAVSVCLLAALPVVQILVHKLFLELASVCAGVLGLNSEGKLVTDIASFLGYTAAVMAISAVFFVLALSMMAAAGV